MNIIKKILRTIFYKLSSLGILNNVKDTTYLKIAYKLRTGKKLNLKNPKTFNEKLQWLKVNDRKDIYTKMVDKYEAKKYVANLIGEEYIIPTIGVYNNFEEIDFTKLPNKFVIKCTHDSGGLVICKNKKKLNIIEAKKKIKVSLKRNYYYNNREWPYKNVKPRIIIEKFMEDKNYKEIIDYKFYCFNGKPTYLYISEGLSNHKTAKIDFLDMNFEKAKFGRNDYKQFDNIPKKPINFEKMKKLAEKLSKNCIFLRVDFYEINKKIYFGELTFTPCSGYMPFSPEEYDKKLGDLINLDINNNVQ